jgi:hypothetical protein
MAGDGTTTGSWDDSPARSTARVFDVDG